MCPFRGYGSSQLVSEPRSTLGTVGIITYQRHRLGNNRIAWIHPLEVKQRNRTSSELRRSSVDFIPARLSVIDFLVLKLLLLVCFLRIAGYVHTWQTDAPHEQTDWSAPSTL